VDQVTTSREVHHSAIETRDSKSHFNILALGFRNGDWQAVFAQALQMKWDRFGN
jgi:hypothetical protein